MRRCRPAAVMRRRSWTTSKPGSPASPTSTAPGCSGSSTRPGDDDLEHAARGGEPPLPLRQRAEPVQVQGARRAPGRRRLDDERPPAPARGRRRDDDLGRHRVDPHVDAREPRAGVPAAASSVRRSSRRPRRTRRTPRPRTTSAWTSCASRSTTPSAPTCAPREPLIGPDTAVVVASAFSYPYGVMDPVEELAALAAAQRRRLPRRRVHRRVRAAVPRAARPRRPAVGLPRRRASPRSPPTCTSTATARRVRRRSCTATPTGSATRCSSTTTGGSGLYGSPGIAGARPAGADRDRVGGADLPRRARATSSIMRDLMATTAKVRAGIEAIDGVEIVGDPIGPVLAFQSDDDRPRTRSAT